MDSSVSTTSCSTTATHRSFLGNSSFLQSTRRIMLLPRFSRPLSREQKKKKFLNYPFPVINTSSDKDLHLKPRPKHKPFHQPNLPEVEDDAGVTSTLPLVHHSSSLCAQIEKLVLFKRYGEALELFDFLRFRGGFQNVPLGISTYDSLVSACIGLSSVRNVKMVFGHMIDSGYEFDQYMRNRVLLMHVKCGMLIDARVLFDEMPQRNEVSWNTIISGLVESGSYKEALGMFLMMWEELMDAGTRTFATVIRACAGLEIVSSGRQLHSCSLKLGLREDAFVSCALIDMYCKCGCIEEAYWVFDEMPEKTVVGWNSIIAGYALNGYSEEALDIYYEMRDSSVKMDHFTYSIILRICARMASLEHAKQAHASLVRNGFGTDLVANTALVDIYCKWGRMEDARSVFDKMPGKNVISWNALIGGYGNHGRGEEAVEMFEKMVKEGMTPNHVTFLAVLGACSYSGLSDNGWKYFETMTREYNIKPRAMHYSCMIELLGREGRLDEALELIKEAPFKPTTNMWGALLTACRMHNDIELGKLAAENLFGLEPGKIGNYIVLLNIYTRSGRLDEAAKVLSAMKRRGLKMLPACSWIEIKKQPYMFQFGDTSHPQTREIYEEVDRLMKVVRKFGYLLDGKSLLPDIEEEEERMTKYHSEKLAVAFGVINTSKSFPLQLVQSHRICKDCHTIIKLIALVTRRDIVVRDSSRFHHFKDGICSCGDYW